MPTSNKRKGFDVGLVTRFKWSVKRRGFLHTVRLGFLKAPRWLAGFMFDTIHDVDTRTNVEICQMSVVGPTVALANRYQPTPPGVLKRIIADLSIPYDKYVFIDYGSGKGRTLLIAAKFPFKHVIGVEFAFELHSVASENIRRVRNLRRHCHSVDSVCVDAIEYTVPNEPAVIYFFYPFSSSLVCRVLDNLRASLSACPRD